MKRRLTSNAFLAKYFLIKYSYAPATAFAVQLLRLFWSSTSVIYERKSTFGGNVALLISADALYF